MPAGGPPIALVGDAELDEGAIWECVADPMVQRLGEVLWIVDLNRQSLDRIVPDIQVGGEAGVMGGLGALLMRTLANGHRDGIAAEAKTNGDAAAVAAPAEPLTPIEPAEAAGS